MKSIRAGNWVVILFGAIACLIVVVRSLSPLALNSDPSVQIGAALSLLNGDGFGTYILNSDLSQSPKINPLTWFAPGLSLILFGLLKLGLSLPISLKGIYAIATLVGWLGWGLIFRDVLVSQQQTATSRGVAVVFAVLLPAYFTYDWVGTDLLLWASIPFITRLFYLSDTRRDWSLWVGCLVGLMYAFRYAAIFMLVGFFLFALVKRSNYLQLGKIVLGFGLFYGSVSVYRALVTTRTPSQLSLSGLLQPEILLKNLIQVVGGLRQVRYLLFSHLSNQIPSGRIVTATAFIVLLIYATILIWGYPSSQERKASNSRLEILLCLNFGLVLFLALISFVSSINFVYLTDHRYYYPLFPSFVIMLYEIGFQASSPRLNRDHILKLTSLVLIGSFIFLSVTIGLRFPERVFGFDRFNAKIHLVEYPSNAIQNRHPESYEATIRLLRQNPQAIAISFAEDFDFFHLEDTGVRRRFLPVSPFDDRIASTHTVSRALQVYFIFGQYLNCKTYCYYDSAQEVKLLKQIPNLKVVYNNQKEQIQILSGTIPLGLNVEFALR